MVSVYLGAFQDCGTWEKYEDKYLKLEIAGGNADEGRGWLLNIPMSLLLKGIVYVCICDLDVVSFQKIPCVLSSLSYNDIPFMLFPFAFWKFPVLLHFPVLRKGFVFLIIYLFLWEHWKSAHWTWMLGEKISKWELEMILGSWYQWNLWKQIFDT